MFLLRIKNNIFQSALLSGLISFTVINMVMYFFIHCYSFDNDLRYHNGLKVSLGYLLVFMLMFMSQSTIYSQIGTYSCLP